MPGSKNHTVSGKGYLGSLFSLSNWPPLWLLTAASAIALSACQVTPKHATANAAADPYHDYDRLATEKHLLSPPEKAALLYRARSWQPADHLQEDAVELASRIEAPINRAQLNIIGTETDDAHRSLAAKLWLIDRAEHTLDLTYYIFKYDLTGKAILGALCEAVQRGVDIRIMVDSVGSLSSNHAPMAALQTCAEQAGHIVDTDGNTLPQKARVQFVIINSLLAKHSWANRRSHDKLMIKDGHFPGKDFTLTGGRNIGLDYYALHENGSTDNNGFVDLEVLFRSSGLSPKSLPESAQKSSDNSSAGDVASYYFSLLFLHKGNRPRFPTPDEVSYRPNRAPAYDDYQFARQHLLAAKARVLAIPAIKRAYDTMPEFIATTAVQTPIKLAHDLINLTAEDVLTQAEDIKRANANSIEGILSAIIEEQSSIGQLSGTFYIVSPYLFIPKYRDKSGNVSHDGTHKIHETLAQHPNFNVEIITNSVLTSDNAFTQSVIDMDTAPRLLLPIDTVNQWLTIDERPAKDGAENTALQQLIMSPGWRTGTEQSRIKIYQLGRADSERLGGPEPYGLLHAKFFFSNELGFVGTSNFDYRSRLYNSEMGFYFADIDATAALQREFEHLKSRSLRWGSPEWLGMRQQLMGSDAKGSFTTRHQRRYYKLMKATGLIWLF